MRARPWKVRDDTDRAIANGSQWTAVEGRLESLLEQASKIAMQNGFLQRPLDQIVIDGLSRHSQE